MCRSLERVVVWKSCVLDPRSAGGVIRVLVRIPVVTPVSLGKTLTYNCFSLPRSKLVPARVETVHANDYLATCMPICANVVDCKRPSVISCVPHERDV